MRGTRASVSRCGSGLAVAIALVLAPATLGVRTGGTGATAAATDPAGRLVLVLDSSGSMKEPAGDGHSKIADARRALGTVITGLPTSAQVGLRVYGATVFSRTNPRACRDTQLVVPIGPADKPALRAAVGRYTPFGETPIAYSLRRAAGDLGTRGHRSIVLVSDGEETCDPDPCAVARSLAGQGVDLRIDVVGFRVSGAARRQLTCIADAGRGSYYDADSAASLAASLDRLSTRAFRPFQYDGTPVHGGDSPGSAAPVELGRYVDTLGGAGQKSYYRVPHAAGTKLSASAFTVLRADPSDPTAVSGESLAVEITTPSGSACASSAGGNGDAANIPKLAAATAQLSDDDLAAGQPCGASDTLVVAVSRPDAGRRAGAPATRNFELDLVAEPAVRGAAGLPEPFDQDTWRFPTGAEQAVPEDGSRVTGGASFADAPTLRAGDYRADVVPGELLVYRVPLEFGQAAALRVDFPTASPALGRALRGAAGQSQLRISAYGPTHVGLSWPFVKGVPGQNRFGTYTGSATTVSTATPQVRYRNRESGIAQVAGAALAGFYYFGVAVQDHGGPSAVIPFRMRLLVVGAPAGAPSYTGPVEGTRTPSASPSRPAGSPAPASARATRAADPGSGGGIRPVTYAAVGLVLVGVLTVGLGVVRRRRG